MTDLEQRVLDVVRTSARSEISVDALERLLSMPRPIIIGLLKTFEAAGYGRFIVGRGSYPSRFARSSTIPLPSTSSASLSPEEPSKPLPQTTTEASDEDRTQVFVLNREKPFRFIAPANLTQQEAEKISRWLALIAEG